MGFIAKFVKKNGEGLVYGMWGDFLHKAVQSQGLEYNLLMYKGF